MAHQPLVIGCLANSRPHCRRRTSAQSDEQVKEGRRSALSLLKFKCDIRTSKAKAFVEKETLGPKPSDREVSTINLSLSQSIIEALKRESP